MKIAQGIKLINVKYNLIKCCILISGGGKPTVAAIGSLHQEGGCELYQLWGVTLQQAL